MLHFVGPTKINVSRSFAISFETQRRQAQIKIGRTNWSPNRPTTEYGLCTWHHTILLGSSHRKSKRDNFTLVAQSMASHLSHNLHRTDRLVHRHHTNGPPARIPHSEHVFRIQILSNVQLLAFDRPSFQCGPTEKLTRLTYNDKVQFEAM